MRLREDGSLTLGPAATSRALRQAPTLRGMAFRATAVTQQQAAGHVLPASGEQYTTPLGEKFNMNKSKVR